MTDKHAHKRLRHSTGCMLRPHHSLTAVAADEVQRCDRHADLRVVAAHNGVHGGDLQRSGLLRCRVVRVNTACPRGELVKDLRALVTCVHHMRLRVVSDTLPRENFCPPATPVDA
jgi:hypothetical protein